MTPEEAIKQLPVPPEMVIKAAWAYLLGIAESMGATRDTLKQLPIPQDIVPGLAWSFLLGTAGRQMLLMGATREQIFQMLDVSMQEKPQ